MKRLLFLLILLPCFVSAQDNKPIGDFYMQSRTVVYQHVFKDSLDSTSIIAARLMSAISINPGMKNMVQSGWIITGNFSGAVTKGDFVIEIRPGRYRVTILNLEQEQSNGFTVPHWETFYSAYVRNAKPEWTDDAHEQLAATDKSFTNLFTLYPTSGLGVW
jgi:hypothetical protein